MRNLKKILALVLALMMVLSVMVTASAADYADADAIEHTEAVEVMSALGILQGDGTNFDPKGTLNRAQAAVIIAKVLEGSVDGITELVDAVENPFSDVPTWAEPYVLYAYSQGIVIGTGADKYAPLKELTGYEFGKMLLIAAGFCESKDFTADSWKLTVATELKDNKLLATLDDVVLSAPLSREHAAQMAFNAMTYATEVEVGYPVYVSITVDGETDTSLVDTYPTLVEAAAAVSVLSTDAPAGYAYSYSVDVMEVTTKSLGLEVFKLRAQPTISGIGYNGYFWYVDTYANGSYTNGYDTKLTSFICTDTVVGTYTKANSWADISAALGYTYGTLDGYKYINSDYNSVVSVPYYSTAKVSTDSSTTVTVVVTADYDVNFLYCDEVVTTAASAKITNKLSPYYGYYTWTFSDLNGTPVAATLGTANSYSPYAYYLVVANGAGAPISIETATTVAGDVSAVANSYIKVNGAQYYKAASMSNPALGAPVTLVLNTAGDIAEIVDGYYAAPTAFDGYAYLTALEYVATQYSATGLLGGSAASVKAVAQLVTAAGETVVVDLPTRVTATQVAQYQFNGAWVTPSVYNVVTNALGTDAGWYGYVVNEDGSYTLVAVGDTTVGATSAKGATLTLDGTTYYMNASTAISLVYYNTDSKSIQTIAVTGYANINDTIAYLLSAGTKVVVTADIYNVISAITVYGTTMDTVVANFAVYAGVTETATIGGVTVEYHGFYVNGELQSYLLADGVSLSLTRGKIVDLVINDDGDIESANAITANPNFTVTRNVTVAAISADGTYFVNGSGAAVSLADGYVVYDTNANGYAVTELVADSTQKVTTIADTETGVVLAIFITTPVAE